MKRKEAGKIRRKKGERKETKLREKDKGTTMRMDKKRGRNKDNK